MDLSPNDIRNYNFPSQMRGYDKEEVDNLLEQVAVALEDARQQNLKLSMEVGTLRTQFTALKEFEDTIKNAAIDARRNADSTIANAKKEAQEIIAKVKEQVEQLATSYQAKKAETEKQMARLEQVKRSYISELRSLINCHLDMVDEIATADIKKDIHGDSGDDPVDEPRGASDSGGIEVTESEDMTRQKVETLADKPPDENRDDDEAFGEEPQGATTEERPPVASMPKPVDPELAAALAKYKAQAEKRVEDLDPEDFGPAPPQGTIVETDRAAEEIPPGFIAKLADAELKRSRAVTRPRLDEFTDEAAESDSSGLSPDAQDRPTEHNAIDIDHPSGEDRARTTVTPSELAQALDSVVKKFEQELDKAEKR